MVKLKFSFQSMEAHLDLKELRIALGLEQLEMAALLGINRSLLSMVESKKRTLPVFALLRLNKINQLLEMYWEENDELKPNLPIEKLEYTRTRYKTVKLNLINAQTTLLEKLHRHQRLQILLSHIEKLQSPDYAPEKDQKWKSTIKNSYSGLETQELELELFWVRFKLEVVDFKLARLESEIAKRKLL